MSKKHPIAAALLLAAGVAGAATQEKLPPGEPAPQALPQPTTVAADVPVPRGNVEFISSEELKKAGYPFSQAVRVGDTLYLSGQIGIDWKTNKLVEGGIEAEAKQTMRNIADVLKANGRSMGDVVKCTAMLADMAEWPRFNDVYRTFFAAGRYPARSALGANGLALGARVEVECIATAK
jgi:reactive intermediate/imine deaminase